MGSAWNGIGELILLLIIGFSVTLIIFFLFLKYFVKTTAIITGAIHVSSYIWSLDILDHDDNIVRYISFIFFFISIYKYESQARRKSTKSEEVAPDDN